MKHPGLAARMIALVCLTAALLAGGRAASAASRYDPGLRFRTLPTAHFLIYFHQGEEAVAQRFAVIAESVHQELTTRLRAIPAGRTHVILVDQNDVSNGWATPLPYDTIEISITPPAPRSLIGNTDDWVRLAFAHEYTHILQLDRARGYASVLRHVFGRSPISFPNLFLPPWQIEGLATYEESLTTGRGRLAARDFALLVDHAARQRQALPLDRASADFDNWPGGNTPYAYGGFFQQYLAERFGDEKLGELSARTAGRFYFLSSPAFKQTFGRSLGDLWRDFERARAERAPAGSAETGRRLTTQGFVVAGPRFVQSAAGRPEIVFSSRTADDFPALMRVDLDGGARRLAPRYYGEQLGVSGSAAVFDQIDLSRSVALRSDLYLIDLVSRGVSRFTTGARFTDSAVSPAGAAIACVRLTDGERHLVVFDLPAGAWPGDIARLRTALTATPRLQMAEPGVEYSSPRWSPDGRTLAASRRLRGGASQIVTVDATTRDVRVLVSSEDARNVTPAWTPDGSTIVFASDRGGGPFNLYAVDAGPGDVATGRAILQVTGSASGATYPDVSPDGRLLAYVGYTVAGYDVFVTPFDRSTWRATVTDSGTPSPDQQPPTNDQRLPTNDQRPPTNDQRLPTNDQRPTTKYRPWPTLLPRYWIPAFDTADQQLKLGAATSGSDVLGRHVYAATVLFHVAGEAGAPGSPRYDWAAGYTYDRWRPAFFADASDRTHFLRTVQLRSGPIVPADLRDENAEAGVLVPDAHVRYQQAFTASVNFQRQILNAGGIARAQADRHAVRLAWFLNSAKLYPYSISREQGATVGVTAEMVRTALGADANANAATVDGRAYVRLGGRHRILAVRGALGAASGDERTERVFYLGGNGPNASPIDFGSDALNLLRGFGQNEFAGTRIAIANLEYRVPLVRVERGVGTWPLFLRTLHAAAFMDFGKTWTAAFSRQPFARSVGAEVAADIRLGYELGVTAAAGIAWPHDAGGVTRPAVAYVRVGHAF
jgi:WD40-like Beta Propeller Repeat/Omp85 superfamily domain